MLRELSGAPDLGGLIEPGSVFSVISHVKKFADFLGRSADKATAEDVHRYQLWLASIGTTVPTVNSVPLPCGSSSRSR